MDQSLIDILIGAGLQNIVIPRKDFIKEHRHLIGLLRKSDNPSLRREASSQEKELDKVVGGNAKAGFIRRLMAENKKKRTEEGEDYPYGRPVWRLATDSTMNKPMKFKFSKIANQSQNGTNETQYGASPFIIKHFGNVRAEQEEDEDEDNAPPPPHPSKRPWKETAEQKEARKKKYPDSKNFPFRGRKPSQSQPQPSSSSSSSTPMGDVLPDQKEEKERPKKKKRVEKGNVIDFTIPEEARGLITEDEVEGYRNDVEDMVKISLLYKVARENLPPSSKWKKTPPLIARIDKLNNKRANNEKMKEYVREVGDRINKRIEERLSGITGKEYIKERNRLKSLTNVPLKELEEKYEKILMRPPITKENVDTFIPSLSASYWYEKNEEKEEEDEGKQEAKNPFREPPPLPEPEQTEASSASSTVEDKKREEPKRKKPIVKSAVKEEPKETIKKFTFKFGRTKPTDAMIEEARKTKYDSLKNLNKHFEKDEIRGLLRFFGGDPRYPNSSDRLHRPIAEVKNEILERVEYLRSL